MCNKNTPSALRPSSKIKKSRTRTRKPKFLSLRLQLSPENTQESGEMSTNEHHHHQLNLFPLHPEHPVEDKDAHEENMAYFFSSGDGGATTLTGLLSVVAGTSSSDDDNTLSPSSLTYAYRGQDSEVGELVRTALKNKERDLSEEKWVCYSEVVERKEEEVSSCDVDLGYKNETRRLSLKLDYEEILNAWSDKGPLYIHAESPQTVPDLHDDFLSHDTTNVHGGVWSVPELMNGNIKIKEEVEEEEWKMGHREASVLRYKEKRHNRLFSKRIRYQVRKLNAEKRPRIKGRFVKRS